MNINIRYIAVITLAFSLLATAADRVEPYLATVQRELKDVINCANKRSADQQAACRTISSQFDKIESFLTCSDKHCLTMQDFKARFADFDSYILMRTGLFEKARTADVLTALRTSFEKLFNNNRIPWDLADKGLVENHKKSLRQQKNRGLRRLLSKNSATGSNTIFILQRLVEQACTRNNPVLAGWLVDNFATADATDASLNNNELRLLLDHLSTLGPVSSSSSQVLFQWCNVANKLRRNLPVLVAHADPDWVEWSLRYEQHDFPAMTKQLSHALYIAQAHGRSTADLFLMLKEHGAGNDIDLDCCDHAEDAKECCECPKMIECTNDAQQMSQLIEAGKVEQLCNLSFSRALHLLTHLNSARRNRDSLAVCWGCEDLDIARKILTRANNCIPSGYTSANIASTALALFIFGITTSDTTQGVRPEAIQQFVLMLTNEFNASLDLETLPDAGATARFFLDHSLEHLAGSCKAPVRKKECTQQLQLIKEIFYGPRKSLFSLPCTVQ